jgi:limonene-1,2-epoxide hydrolase
LYLGRARSQLAAMRIGLATCKHLPEPDHDEALLVAALEAAGVDVALLAWDDDAAPFAVQDLVVPRSTWNYHEGVEAFLAWLGRTAKATTVLNPPRVVAWNATKTYLAELEQSGIAVVPTAYVMRGAPTDVGEMLASRGWDEIVIKPQVSAGSFRTQRFGRGSVPAAQSFLDALAADRDAMVQAWMPSVETYGERSVVWIDGAITHAVRKSPRFAGTSEHASTPVAIADDERVFAERAVARFARELLYARVDMVRDPEGALCLMELELVEPSLFFAQAPHARSRFVAAILRRLRTPHETASM